MDMMFQSYVTRGEPEWLKGIIAGEGKEGRRV